MAVDTEASQQLKHLQFVEAYAKSAAAAVASVGALYERAKSVAPQFIGPYVVHVEERVAAYSAPALVVASDRAEKLLKTADAQVDALFLASAKWLSLEPLRQLHASNLETYKAAKEQYFALVASTTDWAASKLSPDKNVQYAKETLQAALAKADEAADPDAAVLAAHEAWVKFAEIPAVAKVLETTAPITHKGYETFQKLHDYIVRSPLYLYSVKAGAKTLLWAIQTVPYRLASEYLYPHVQFIADPAFDKLSKSVYITKALQYWTPVVQAVA